MRPDIRDCTEMINDRMQKEREKREHDRLILQNAIDTYGTEAQTDMMIEEMSELTKALLKRRRADDIDKNGAMGHVLKNNICEEMADVQIMLWQMMMIYGSAEEHIAHKLERLEKRLNVVKIID